MLVMFHLRAELHRNIKGGAEEPGAEESPGGFIWKRELLLVIAPNDSNRN